MGWFQQMWIYTKGWASDATVQMWTSRLLALVILVSYIWIAAIVTGPVMWLALILIYFVALWQALDWAAAAKYRRDNGQTMAEALNDSFRALGRAEGRADVTLARLEEANRNYN